MRIITLSILVLQCFSLLGQDSVLVTKNFSFEDGVYLNFKALKSNQPTYTWEEVTSTYFTNPTSFLAEVQELTLDETETAIPLEKVFAVCIKGIPYLRIEDQTFGAMEKFSGLKVRGVLSYLSYEISSIKKVKIQAYNPLNGEPFRTGFVDKKITTNVEKVLNWKNGLLHDFNQTNLKEFVNEDTPLLNSIEDLEEWELEEKLFKCLLIYNDRHSVYVPKRSL